MSEFVAYPHLEKLGHLEVAELPLGIKEREAEKDRRARKALGFGMRYGASLLTLADTIGVSTGRARDMLEDFRRRHGRDPRL